MIPQTIDIDPMWINETGQIPVAEILTLVILMPKSGIITRINMEIWIPDKIRIIGHQTGPAAPGRRGDIDLTPPLPRAIALEVNIVGPMQTLNEILLESWERIPEMCRSMSEMEWRS
jgi:hypothetical protein